MNGDIVAETTGPIWRALMIGNSRSHWAEFTGATLQKTWDTPHLPPLGHPQRSPVPLIMASVVPAQTSLWQDDPQVRILSLKDLPLQGLYSTLGIDRALAVLGVGTEFGWPVCVIDAGTALTFTGANVNKQLVGGAILPGLGLQLSSLTEKTATLPPVSLPEILPERWATTTATAIQSGVIYTVLAGVREFIEQWQSEFPQSKIALAGGDSKQLLSYLQARWPHLAETLIEAPQAIFWGIKAVWQNRK